MEKFGIAEDSIARTVTAGDAPGQLQVARTTPEALKMSGENPQGTARRPRG